MESFADYILQEKGLGQKMEIVYYLSKRNNIFFNKSVIFKTEIARLFLNHSKPNVDTNLITTASLLCNCKKVDNAQDKERIQSYAKQGAEYLYTLGFDEKFCKICEEINRYSGSQPREKESDILEVVDQFGGMLLDREERIGFKPDEALIMLQQRNLKGKNNYYLDQFAKFVGDMEQIQMSDVVSMSALRRLTKIHNDTPETTNFIRQVINSYEPRIDKIMSEKENVDLENPSMPQNNISRPLFSEETTRRIMGDSERIDNKEEEWER